jgi:hypothetical protein
MNIEMISPEIREELATKIRQLEPNKVITLSAEAGKWKRMIGKFIDVLRHKKGHHCDVLFLCV